MCGVSYSVFKVAVRLGHFSPSTCLPHRGEELSLSALQRRRFDGDPKKLQTALPTFFFSLSLSVFKVFDLLDEEKIYFKAAVSITISLSEPVNTFDATRVSGKSTFHNLSIVYQKITKETKKFLLTFRLPSSRTT